MELGMVGLGRMGASMVHRLLRGGHTVVGYARHRSSVDAPTPQGIRRPGSRALLSRSRLCWDSQRP